MRTCADSLLCVATDGAGAFVVNTRTEQVVEHYGTQERAADHRLPGNAVYTFLRSTSKGINCLGLFNQGLVHTFFEYPLFHAYHHEAYDFRGTNVTCLFNDGCVHLLASNGCVYFLNEQTGEGRLLDISRFGMRLPRLVRKFAGDYFIGSYDTGLLRLDGQTLSLSRIQGQPQLAYATVTDMDTDAAGRLWVATSEGFYVFGPDGSVRHMSEQNSNIPMGLKSICFDAQGVGWVGCSAGTCLLMDEGLSVKDADFPKGFFNHIPNMQYTVCDGRIFGFYQNQVYYTDPDMQHFGRLQLPASVISERCLDICADDRGRYWLASEKGLFCFTLSQSPEGELQARDFRRFGSVYGLAGTSLNSGTLFLEQGCLWVGTNDGVYVMELQQLGDVTRSDALPRFAVGPENVIVGSHHYGPGELLQLYDERQLHVSWNFVSQDVVIRPMTNSFPAGGTDCYEWRMDDHTEYQAVAEGEGVAIGHLSVGSHQLHIRQMGFPETETVYTIYVLPSWLFWLEIITLLVATTLFIWWRSWKRNTKLLLTEHHETEQALIEEMRGGGLSKYQKSRSSDEELERLFHRMDEYVRTQKPYLNKDSKMSDIAAALKVSPSQLSQVFTLHAQEPYYDYINRLRLEEFMRLIEAGKHKQFTITALSEQCGFKKTAFFSTFRKLKGTTPTEYIQKMEKN